MTWKILYVESSKKKIIMLKVFAAAQLYYVAEKTHLFGKCRGDLLYVPNTAR